MYISYKEWLQATVVPQFKAQLGKAIRRLERWTEPLVRACFPIWKSFGFSLQALGTRGGFAPGTWHRQASWKRGRGRHAQGGGRA